MEKHVTFSTPESEEDVILVHVSVKGPTNEIAAELRRVAGFITRVNKSKMNHKDFQESP